jgi:hypothetical protein
MRFIMAFVVLLLAPGSNATAGIGRPAPEVEVSGTSAVITPSGTTPALDVQNLTIVVRVFGGDGLPLAGLPADQIQIVPANTGGLPLCSGVWTADSMTDAEGYTTFNRALAGGSPLGNEFVAYASGSSASHPFSLQLLSPDYDGNLVVDTVDFGVFGQDYGETGVSRSDFAGAPNWELTPDGKVDLNDLVVFAEHFGESCD